MTWLVVLTFVVALITGIFSGMGGGGGGFIMTPYFLFIGLPPANAIATMKLGGIGTAFGSITAFRGKGFVHKKLVVPLMVIMFICALISAWLIPNIDPEVFRKLIGGMLLVLAPTVFIKKASLQPGIRPKSWIVAGFIVFAVISFLQTLLASGLGSILILVLMFLFGLGTLESQATKRVVMSVQAIVLFVLLSIQSLVMWAYGIAGLLGASIGSHIGTHIAIKRGDQFVKVMMAAVMLTSGIALLV